MRILAIPGPLSCSAASATLGMLPSVCLQLAADEYWAALAMPSHKFALLMQITESCSSNQNGVCLLCQFQKSLSSKMVSPDNEIEANIHPEQALAVFQICAFNLSRQVPSMPIAGWLSG